MNAWLLTWEGTDRRIEDSFEVQINDLPPVDTLGLELAHGLIEDVSFTGAALHRERLT
jgi:hypothetical protein